MDSHNGHEVELSVKLVPGAELASDTLFNDMRITYSSYLFRGASITLIYETLNLNNPLLHLLMAFRTESHIPLRMKVRSRVVSDKNLC